MSKKNYDMTVLKNKKTLTKDEATFYIGISIKTLERIIDNGGFYPLARIGCGRGRIFINREKLDQWLDEQDGSYKPIR